jgi:hypothetical protein
MYHLTMPVLSAPRVNGRSRVPWSMEILDQMRKLLPIIEIRFLHSSH